MVGFKVSCVRRVLLILQYLHSNMVGFKAERFRHNFQRLINLHSNMVGFKATRAVNTSSTSVIYIPIWWDLKGIAVAKSKGAYKFTFQYGGI